MSRPTYSDSFIGRIEEKGRGFDIIDSANIRSPLSESSLLTNGKALRQLADLEDIIVQDRHHTVNKSVYADMFFTKIPGSQAFISSKNLNLVSPAVIAELI